MTVLVKKDQSIFDIVCQYFGRLDELVYVSSENNISISDLLSVDDEIEFDTYGKGNKSKREDIIKLGLTFNNYQE